jgi:hypothetical protein
MKRLLLAALLLVPPVMAQDTTFTPPEKVQKLVTLKYADPQSVSNLISVFGLDSVRVDGHLKVISLSGTKARVASAEEAIKQLDVPSAAPKNIELTVFFVVGSDQNPLAGNPIPAELQPVVTQLKTTFPFKAYTLLDVLALRTRSGSGAETSGQLNGSSRLSTFRVQSASVDGDGSNIRLEHLHAGVRNLVSMGDPLKKQYVDTGISADVVDVKDGQKLVIGRSSLDGPEKALFLVLIAKVIN